MVVRERFLGGLLAYLVGGNLQAARVIPEEAAGDEAGRSVLKGGHNPLAKAAAGYVMLATERDGRSRFTDEWFEALMKDHTWMPDGAILFAR